MTEERKRMVPHEFLLRAWGKSVVRARPTPRTSRFTKARVLGTKGTLQEAHRLQGGVRTVGPLPGS